MSRCAHAVVGSTTSASPPPFAKPDLNVELNSCMQFLKSEARRQISTRLQKPASLSQTHTHT